MKRSFLYKPKAWATALYLLTIAGALTLHLGKKSVLLHAGISVERNHEISLHISNFSISYILCLVVGYIWLLYGATLNRALYFTAAVIVINFVYELFLPLLNTPDITDAYYGVAGSILAGMVLLLIKKRGLKLSIPKEIP